MFGNRLSILPTTTHACMRTHAHTHRLFPQVSFLLNSNMIHFAIQVMLFFKHTRNASSQGFCNDLPQPSSLFSSINIACSFHVLCLCSNVIFSVRSPLIPFPRNPYISLLICFYPIDKCLILFFIAFLPH